MAEKIGHVNSDWLLAPEAGATQTMATQFRPQELLGVSLISAQ
jgi:hypothetical protein